LEGGEIVNGNSPGAATLSRRLRGLPCVAVTAVVAFYELARFFKKLRRLVRKIARVRRRKVYIPRFLHGTENGAGVYV